MDRTISCGSVGLQHPELRELAQAVTGPLKSGLHSFNSVSEMLLSVNADMILPGCQSFCDITREIENMKQQMEKSEQVAIKELQRIDGQTEHLIVEQSNLAKQKRQIKCELGELKTHLESHRSSLNTSNQALERARKNLKSAEDDRDNMRQGRDEAETVRNVGIGVTLIPIVGWIAGPIMVGVGESNRIWFSEAVDSAKKEIENCESQVRLYSGKATEYSSLISQAQRDIQEADNKIHETEAKLRGVSVKREFVADVQAKMRGAVHQLGLLYGVGRAAELQTRCLILLEPVMRVMEEMTTVLGQITGEELLYTAGIKRLMLDMKANHSKLKQLADTNKSAVYTMDTQIAKTTQSLTTAAEMRDTTMMLMKPNANWEEYLTPAPLSIAIMGELVFISSCDDFSINRNAPPNGFKYIKYPNSFRACLMQICNSGWHAFNEAHNNMDQIRIHTSTVPDYMKTAVNILFNASDEVIETVLPLQLESIRTIADDCVTLAGSVEKKYSDVINLIHELLESCVNAKCFYGEELENVKLKLEETKLREQTATELKEQSRKVMESMSRQMEEVQDAYKKSMDSLPSGWEMIGMDFVEGITSSMTGIMNGFTSLFTGFSKKAGGSGGSSEHQDIGDEDVDEITKIGVCCKSGEILNLAMFLKQYVKEDEIDWKNLYDQKNKCTNAVWIKNQFKRIFQELEKMPKNKLHNNALSLCERGIAICKQLEKYNPGEKWNKTKTKELIKRVEKLNAGALTFDSRSKKTLNSPALGPKPPMMFKAQNSSSGHQSASQRASENARFRIEQSREQLKQTRQSYEKSAENMEKNQKELNDILIEMQNCKIAEIDFDTKIKMLVKGLDAMGRVKEQWEKMVRFFQMVSNIVKTSLSKTLHNFVETCDVSKKLTYDNNHFTKDLLYTQAFQASNIASMVHMISATYTEVSNNYLMDRVSSLGKLMAMDPEKPEFLHERLKLQKSCKEAQDSILQLVMKNKKEFERKTDSRLAKIEGELKAILPAAPPQDTEKIKEIVQAGFDTEEGGVEDYY